MALGLVFGTAIGASIENIKIGVAFGVLVGVVLETLMILLGVYKRRKR